MEVKEIFASDILHLGGKCLWYFVVYLLSRYENPSDVEYFNELLH